MPGSAKRKPTTKSTLQWLKSGGQNNGLVFATTYYSICSRVLSQGIIVRATRLWSTGLLYWNHCGSSLSNIKWGVQMVRGYIYTKDDCPQCRMTEQLVHGPWTIHNVTGDERVLEQLRRQGYQQFPVIEVFGDYALLDSWTGFRPDKVKYWDRVVSK